VWSSMTYVGEVVRVKVGVKNILGMEEVNNVTR
jgi:hypothetical protein